ncbi:hypothetical protein B0H14DRAFT_2790033 [Mycena olivaceomarginata]|nr:hypothetical protein B0H14DRAFT_2790033 [Mycena olivaceomarginata]
MAVERIPQEIWDKTIDNLQNSPKTLKFCSLVCRSFVARSQFHIFSTISVHRAPNSDCFKRSLQKKWLARLIRLVDNIKSSPHLIPYVHTIDVESCDTELLAVLAQVSWSQVRTLSISEIAITEEGPVSESVISLLELEFGVLNWCSVNFVRALFARCSPSLESLSLNNCKLKTSSCLTISAEPVRFTLPCPKIRELILRHSPYVVALLHSACPLDFSALMHLCCVGDSSMLDGFLGLSGGPLGDLMPSFQSPPNPDLMNGFLRRNGGTIQSLEIDTIDHSLKSFNLTALPAVHRLSAADFVQGGGLCDLLVRWPMPQRISSIRLFTSTGFMSEPRWAEESSCGRLDRLAFDRVSLPGLQKVEVVVSITVGGFSPLFRRGAIVPTVQAAMPRLNERGLLSVSIALKTTSY